MLAFLCCRLNVQKMFTYGQFMHLQGQQINMDAKHAIKLTYSCGRRSFWISVLRDLRPTFTG